MKNPELESISQFVVVLNLILATPAMSLVPNCNGLAVPLDPSPTWRGGHAAWATACPPHNTAHLLNYLPLLPHLERTLSFAIRVDTTREEQIPVISHHSTGVERCARRCSRRWERSSDLTGQIALLKLGSPQPVRCSPATVCHPHWVHGDKGPSEKQTATMVPGNHKQNHQKKVLEYADNDDRPLYKPARHHGLQEDSSHERQAEKTE